MDDRLSRRAFLGAVATGAAGAAAGCATARPQRIGDEGIPPATFAETQFRGGLERRGVYPEATVPEEPEVAWQIPEINTGEHTAAKASPVATPDGDIVVPGDNREIRRVAPDGTVEWKSTVEETPRGMHGTPAVANGTVYVGAYDGALYAFDLETGERFWRTKLGDAIGSSPGYHDGTVYIAVEYYEPSGAMFAVDAVTGDVEWDDQRPTSHPHSTCAVDREAGRLVVGSNDTYLYAWSYPELEFEWKFDTGDAIKGPIATYDGSAFFGSWDDNVYRVALDDGTEEWTFETGAYVMSGPSIEAATETVYIGSHDRHLYALDAATGDERWSFDTGGSLIGCPTVTSEHVLVGSYDNHCYAVRKANGEKAWAVESTGVATSTPLALDGAVYFTDRADQRYVDVRHGTATATDGTGADPSQSGKLYKVVDAA